MIRTVLPTASQAIRQSLASITACAIIGITTSPAISATVEIEVTKVRLRTNQLTIEP